MKYLRIVLSISVLALMGSIVFQQDWFQNGEEQNGDPTTFATLQLKVEGMT